METVTAIESCIPVECTPEHESISNLLTFWLRNVAVDKSVKLMTDTSLCELLVEVVFLLMHTPV